MKKVSITFKGFDELPDIYPPRNKRGEYSSSENNQWFNLELFKLNILRVFEKEDIPNIKPTNFHYDWFNIDEVDDWDSAEEFVHHRILVKYPELDYQQSSYDTVYDLAFNIIKQTQLNKTLN
jgi:hypothetical protein